MRYVKEFLTARKLDGLAPGTLDQYRMELKKFASHLDKPTIDTTTNDLRGYLIQFNEMAQRTVNRKISTLKAFYSWLINEEYIERNPTKKIKTPREPASLPRNLSHEDVELLRWHSKSPRNQAIMELLVSSGMRIGELVSLDRNDLSMANRQIRVTGKGNKERLVFFGPIAKFCLISYLNTRKDDNPALFTNKYGARLTVRSVEMQIKDQARKAGIKDAVTPHMLRHTFASGMYEQGADIDFIARLLGHESTDTTRKYTHVNASAMAQMYDKYLVS
ncbi:site-specific tyrosine recombinase/integron integrase [Desulfosporosinus nitroreducens]|uniref:site-specific tyrosine recombinase/integron integrase n=1 Tax=Desulfosporosinus nitroreducens TaxID=2018668 RepID=UPI00207C1B38|nr:site-specific tyrosine recombinase/integron integrase [Desulfosporosinus nitroreducens]MCO1599810.1 tyrosine-type recombinase/integrase [Desulfosporosinus nitroreducens]